MITTPKAAKFRIRRTAATPPPARPPVEDGFGPEPFPTAEQDMLVAPPDAGTGMTARQTRQVRRVAQKHGIETDDDQEALRQLQAMGVDPFQKSELLELVNPAAGLAEAVQPQLPQTVRPDRNLPGHRIVEDGERAAEVMRIQRDIVRRRRRNILRLAARLAVMVVLPTLVAGWYYFSVATPLYATRSEFVIQQADSAAAPGMGSIFRGTQFATTQDAITVQSYLTSRDAMLRLDQDMGFKAHFSDPSIDPIQRLEANATNEAAYKIYKRNVKIGYDPTEGIIKMEVIAADPAVSQRFSEALIGYAEEQVDALTQRLREDQMKGARESYADAEVKVSEAQAKVLSLQEQLGVLDPLTESSVAMSQIGTFETELQKKRLELQQLLDNTQPNQARVDGVRGDITRLETLIADLRSQLTEGHDGTVSLAAVTGQLRIAEADLETRQLLLSQALTQLETARIEANRQVRYLSLGVPPIAPDEPTYPRAFENTLLALLIFGGIYLMLSLTASVLREQVTA